MNKTVDVAIPVEEAAAVKLADAKQRALMGRVISRMLSPSRQEIADELAALFAETQAAAQSAGLTERMVEEELAAWKAERRARRSGG